MSVVHSNSQTIHCVVNMLGNTSTRVSFAYVRPNRRAKDIFWDGCKEYANAVNGHWVIMGDFNDIGSVVEQWGSTYINFGNINRFVERYNDCGL